MYGSEYILQVLKQLGGRIAGLEGVKGGKLLDINRKNYHI